MCWNYSSFTLNHQQHLEFFDGHVKTALFLFSFSVLLFLVSFSTKTTTAAAAAAAFPDSSSNQKMQPQQHRTTKVTKNKDNNTTPMERLSLYDDVDVREVTITLRDHDDGDMLQTKLVVGIPKKIVTTQGQKPILIFLHGSFHSSWCYNEHFVPYFVTLGYPVLAYSWRGTYDTPVPPASRTSSSSNNNTNTSKKVKIGTHCHDLHELFQQLPTIFDKDIWESSGKKPILICHSFAGLYVMKYLEQEYFKNNGRRGGFGLLGGIICLCCIPPSGMKSLTTRCLYRRPWKDTWDIIKGLAMKRCLYDVSLCRKLFFDNDTSEEDIQRYQTYFRRDGLVTIDLANLKKELPSLKCDKEGRAPFVTSDDFPPALVIGAKHDFIVDLQATIETCKYFGVSSNDDDEQLVMVDSPHDIMLGKAWEETANIINNWISKNRSTTSKFLVI